MRYQFWLFHKSLLRCTRIICPPFVGDIYVSILFHSICNQFPAYLLVVWTLHNNIKTSIAMSNDSHWCVEPMDWEKQSSMTWNNVQNNPAPTVSLYNYDKTYETFDLDSFVSVSMQIQNYSINWDINHSQCLTQHYLDMEWYINCQLHQL